MSDLFHVFIERPRSDAPDAVPVLARAIAARYGLPAQELEVRFAAGRFRVKGNVDRTTADQFAADLTRLGAIVTVASAAVPPATGTKPVSLQAVERAPAPPPPSRSSSPELGALSGEFPLTLSTLDGASAAEEPRASASRKIMLPASFGPEPDEAPAVAAVDDGAPVEVFDPFAPPEQQGRAPELVLAVERPSRKAIAIDAAHAAAAAPAAPPPPHAPPPPTMAAPPLPARATIAPAPTPATSQRLPVARPDAGGWRGALRDDGHRLIAGVVLAFALGAAPALLIGHVRERAAFTQLDAELDRQQEPAKKDPEAWDRLDRLRASFVDRKEAERMNLAITSLLIWAVISGGVAAVWFRVIDWDRILR